MKNNIFEDIFYVNTVFMCVLFYIFSFTKSMAACTLMFYSIIIESLLITTHFVKEIVAKIKFNKEMRKWSA